MRCGRRGATVHGLRQGAEELTFVRALIHCFGSVAELGCL